MASNFKVEDRHKHKHKYYCERPHPRPVFRCVRPNPHEWVELCYCLSKWKFNSYIYPFRLRVLQWNRHLFNYWDK